MGILIASMCLSDSVYRQSEIGMLMMPELRALHSGGGGGWQGGGGMSPPGKLNVFFFFSNIVFDFAGPLLVALLV